MYRGRPLRDSQSEKLMMLPPPARRMCGQAAREQMKADRMSTATFSSYSSTVSSLKGFAT